MRSASLRSSSSRRTSFSIALGVIGPIGVHETEVVGEESFDDQPKKVVDSKGSARRLAYMNRPELPAMLLGTIAAVIQGVITPVFGLLLSSSIKIFYEPPRKLRIDSRFWALTFVCLGLVGVVFGPMQQYFFGVAGGKLILRIRSMCYEKVVHQDMSWFDDPANSRFAN